MNGTTAAHPRPGPASEAVSGDQLANAVGSARTGETWAIATTVGHTVTGYLPPWADADPSATDVPLDRLFARLADVTHRTPFDGQSLQVHSPASGCAPSQAEEQQAFFGGMECTPYAEDPEPRVPVVNLAIIDDLWINGLDPTGLAEVAAKLRAQADRLDYEVHPALIAARADWAAHHA